MQAKQLRQLEATLWKAADDLRANSKLTASEYSMPVLGLIFLRHAYNRFKKVKQEIEQTRTSNSPRGIRPLTKADFQEKNAMFLPYEATYEYLTNLPEEKNLGEALDNAITLIENEYENLNGVLPKKFSSFSDDLLISLVRTFDNEVLKDAEGDVFGKIYEYFLNKFAMTGAQEGGEFFTPPSLVQTIVNIIEPNHGTVFDPACGSAGMFVQTGYFLEKQGLKTAEKVTFFGQEKADLNTNLAKINLAVHGLEGKILQGNTFYEDKHELVGKADFVMANPPFNVDGVDRQKEFVKKDARLVLDGKVNLPKNDNANYLWIQYFYNYLKPTGKAGFVMASSASDAGHSERDIRQKLVETGAVDVMVAISNNFFYTRSLPCTLWFYDRSKENDTKKSDEVLMLDARKIYRKVSSKINDFSPEQLQNLVAIVNLYKGNNQRLETTLNSYLNAILELSTQTLQNLTDLQENLKAFHKTMLDFAKSYEKENKAAELFTLDLEVLELNELYTLQNELIQTIKKTLEEKPNYKKEQDLEKLKQLANQAKALKKPQDKTIKQFFEILTAAQKEHQLNKNKEWKQINTKEQIDTLTLLQHQLTGNPKEEELGTLTQIDYFYKQTHWLQSRFPTGNYADIEGLCKVVTQKEIEEKDWSLSPGRYVGVAAQEEDEDFDYEERLKEIHIELESLNTEANQLANLISQNFNEIVL